MEVANGVPMTLILLVPLSMSPLPYGLPAPLCRFGLGRVLHAAQASGGRMWDRNSLEWCHRIDSNTHWN